MAKGKPPRGGVWVVRRGNRPHGSAKLSGLLEKERESPGSWRLSFITCVCAGMWTEEVTTNARIPDQWCVPQMR